MTKVSSKWVSGASFEQETPSGTINGVNTEFTLSRTPAGAKAVILFLDGDILAQGSGAGKYTTTGTTITMGTAPALGQSLYAWYAY